jgi:hypothetical protein
LFTAYLFARGTFGTIYRPYDDEGYMLESLQHYLSGEKLHREVYTQYGPFQFLLPREIVYRSLGVPVNHYNGRGFTVFLWLLSHRQDRRI